MPAPSVVGGGALHHPKNRTSSILSFISPSHTGESPGVLRVPQCTMHNLPPISLNIAMLWGAAIPPILKGLHTPSHNPQGEVGRPLLLGAVPLPVLSSLTPILAPQFMPTQPLVPTNTGNMGVGLPPSTWVLMPVFNAMLTAAPVGSSTPSRASPCPVPLGQLRLPSKEANLSTCPSQTPPLCSPPPQSTQLSPAPGIGGRPVDFQLLYAPLNLLSPGLDSRYLVPFSPTHSAQAA